MSNSTVLLGKKKTMLVIKYVSLEFHKLTEWFGLEGTLKITWFQPPCHRQGHLLVGQAAQSPIQPGLERCQGRGSHRFSGQPVPVPHHPQSEEFHPHRLGVPQTDCKQSSVLRRVGLTDKSDRLSILTQNNASQLENLTALHLVL